jgi:hypothetical protein
MGGDSRLPAFRNACIMRQAIKVVKDEISSIDNRLKALQLNHNSDTKSETVTEKQIDFGFDGEWETLKDVCAEKRVDKYNYKICFFDSVKQDSTLIGRFSHWGLSENPIPKSTKKHKKISFGNIDNSTKEDSISDNIQYQYQRYLGGDKCHSGRQRLALVEFICGTKNEIIDIEELEVLVRINVSLYILLLYSY